MHSSIQSYSPVGTIDKIHMPSTRKKLDIIPKVKYKALFGMYENYINTYYTYTRKNHA